MKNLKSLFSLLSFTLLFSGMAMSQGLGFKAGLNLANVKISSEFEDDTDTKIGFQLGAFYELSAGESLTVRPGISYSGKGSKESGGDSNISLGYIDVPVDVVYKFDAGSNKVSVHAGPYLGLLLSAGDEEGEDLKDFFKSTDFGLNLGVSYELSNIIIGLNYGLGLSNIIDDPDAPEDFSAKNTNISLTLGYRL